MINKSCIFEGVSRFYKKNSFRISIVAAVCAALLLPASIGYVAVDKMRHESLTNELARALNDKASFLSLALTNPILNKDLNAAAIIADEAMKDPLIIRITIKGPDQELLFSLKNKKHQPIDPSNKIIEMKDGKKTVGFIEIAIDDAIAQEEFYKDQRAFAIIIASQVGLALLFIVFILHFKLLLPLARLSRFSRELAVGNFNAELHWKHKDEIGELASQMERMRSDLRKAFSEKDEILDNIQLGVVMVKNNCIEIANHHAEQMFGFSEDAMQGVDIKTLYASDRQFCAINNRAQTAISSPDGRYDQEIFMTRSNGDNFWARVRGSGMDLRSPVDGSIWVFEDVSSRKAAETEIHNLAFYDTLTSLPNRRLLLEHLKQALLSSKRTGNYGALLFIDLDNFKTLNDTFGHAVGDILLQKVGERLAASVRQKDTVARIGGDEFVVLLEDMSEDMQNAAGQVKNIGDKILASLNGTYQLKGHVHHSTPSIGVALFSGKEESVDELLKRADMAMYESKEAGRNTLRFFDKKMQDLLIRRSVLEDDLRSAVEKEEFLLHYQPQILNHQRITGVEALIRWIHPTRGMVSPLEFIPLAEECGLILPIGDWVIKTACRQLTLWALRPEMADFTISVNVSARQFRQPLFVDKVLQILEQTGANPYRLKLELTESMLVDDVEDVIIKMNQLKTHGVGFSLDDFGTGYSSLAYLKRLPLEQLKIDQGFIRNILHDPNDAAIAKMVVALALSMGLTVIAEGVELDDQRKYLALLGCDSYQGYLYSKPLPLEVLEEFCKTWFDKQKNSPSTPA